MSDSEMSRHNSESDIAENPRALFRRVAHGDFPVSDKETIMCKLCLERDAAIVQSLLFEGKIYHDVSICPICFLAVYAHGFAVGNTENIHQIPLFDSEPS